jgi:hypothetical protein
MKTDKFIKCIFNWLFIFSVFAGTPTVLAQTYPVHLTTQLVTPFSGYLPDYANTAEEKLKVLVLFTDFTKPSYNIKLKISIQGQGISIQSKSYFFAGPFTVQPGVPLEISGNDLYSLLNSQNLDFTGIDKAQYEQRKVLPEGFYTFCVTAYDYNNPIPIQVSNNSCSQAWMILSDPPFLNLPICSSTITPTNPQQLAFAFTQMNMGSPNSAANTEYVFELWEIRPQGAIPNNIVQTVPPIFSYTTNITTVNYGITEPPLLLGMQYAWRVRAVDITGRDLFKNQGYSQVCTFTYGNIFDGSNINLNLHAQGVSQRQIKVWWDSLSTFTNYNLEFRKAGSGGNWYPVTTPNCRVRILDLEPQTTYEFHVQGSSQDYTSPFSANVNAATLPIPNYQCGEIPVVPNSAQFMPLTSANINMIWQVGQFEMRVLGLQNPMSNSGMYSGFGKILMPYGITVNCNFANVSVNSDQVLVQGRVVALTQGVDTWISNGEMGAVQDGTSDPEVQINSPLTTSSFNVDTANGTVTVGGNTYTYTPNGETFEDNNGNIFVVTADGQVIQAGTQGTGHGPVPDSKNIINPSKGIIAFKADAKQLYGLDEFKHQELIHYYLTVKNVMDNTHPPVNWKSVMAQKYDIIDLDYQLNSGLKSDSILFITGTGTVYKSQGTGTSRKLYIIGGQHGDVQELFACYKVKKDSFVNIAKINIVSYRNEQNKVTLVPLGNNISIDKTQLQKQLNDIYKQSVATWEVSVAPAITVGDTLWDKDANGRINTGSNLFTRYSKEMSAINKYIRTQTYYNASEYYLVVTNKPTDSLAAGLLGEMPRGRNIGYIFTSTPTATLVAHELGHGAFALEHSFDGNATLPKNSSTCLMDYTNGTELYKGKYWDYVHNPVTIIGVTEGDDDGAMSTEDGHKFINAIINKIKKSCKDDSSIVLIGNFIGRFTATNVYLGGIHYDNIFMTVKKPTSTKYVLFHSKGKIRKLQNPEYWNLTTATSITTTSTLKPMYFLSIDNRSVEFWVSDDKIDILNAYLQDKLEGKNLLVFANGYRPNPPSLIENPKMPDVVNLTDINAYWKGIDAMFINKIGTRNVVYGDGHHTVGTANHRSQTSFLLNMLEAKCASGIDFDIGPFVNINGYLSITAPLTTILCAGLYHNSLLFNLHTIPNDSGFLVRRNSGRIAGQDLLNKISNGTIKFDKDNDTIDIVSHSMGHAYALGIIDAIKDSPIKYKLGRFYCLAPENGCSSNGSFDIGLFEEVWQYGSNDKARAKWEQDGIAPQCAIPDITSTKKYLKTKHGRVHFPDNIDPKNFMDCHTIVHYFWLFSKTKTDEGYVKPRN